GVNNHMGSKLTASSEKMRQIFTILKKRKLFFVDSRTSADTLCRPSAELLHLPFAERDVFIDHEQTRGFVKKQLKLLIKRAKRQGYAIGIAHPHPVTIAVLKEMLPELRKAVFLTHASQVVAFQQG
ncbi:MAG: divergent polysaccharide deacetylase family protein, partial [Desulfobacteraceae bacterium]|nr:divergent polysaccharide deacetylase family protein [Desulfobacteraceae bacterium]